MRRGGAGLAAVAGLLAASSRDDRGRLASPGTPARPRTPARPVSRHRRRPELSARWFPRGDATGRHADHGPGETSHRSFQAPDRDAEQPARRRAEHQHPQDSADNRDHAQVYSGLLRRRRSASRGPLELMTAGRAAGEPLDRQFSHRRPSRTTGTSSRSLLDTSTLVCVEVHLTIGGLIGGSALGPVPRVISLRPGARGGGRPRSGDGLRCRPCPLTGRRRGRSGAAADRWSGRGRHHRGGRYSGDLLHGHRAGSPWGASGQRRCARQADDVAPRGFVDQGRHHHRPGGHELDADAPEDAPGRAAGRRPDRHPPLRLRRGSRALRPVRRPERRAVSLPLIPRAGLSRRSCPRADGGRSAARGWR